MEPLGVFVLVIEQDRYEVRLDLRTDTGWTSRRLTDPEDLIEIPRFGFRCRVVELYRQTPLGRERPAARG